MTLKILNTMTGRKEAFEPIDPGRVRMYNCGPTVYDYATIGNFRSFLFADLLRRTLERQGYQVTQVMNITDVGHLVDDADEGDDKVDAKARSEKVDPYTITRRYEEAFHEDAKALRIRSADHYPRATDHIQEIIELVQALLDRGHAYQVDGEVYYSIDSFPAYGQLSGNRPEGLRAGARLAVNDRKKDPADFALWKTDPKHLMQWESPWGSGFPGWHVECSAMSAKYLGKSFDIHTGGEDNIFPHHECEIAQSEGATGQTFVRYWMHARFLMVNGEKMSKSKGNFFTVRDLLAKGYSGREIRYALMNTHYRQNLNFTLDGLAAARAALERIDRFVLRLRQLDGETESPGLADRVELARERFDLALCDDLNVSGALGQLFELMTDVNKLSLHRPDGERILALLAHLDPVLGYLDLDVEAATAPPELLALVEERQEARRRRDFAQSDILRDAIGEAGWTVEDTPDGPRLVKTIG